MCTVFKTNLSCEKINENQCRELCITRFVLFCYVIVISPRALNLSMGRWCYPSPPSPPISTREPVFFSRAQKRALESTELAYRKERTSRQTGFISFLLLILLLLYFYILLGYLLPSTCHPNEALSEKAKNPQNLCTGQNKVNRH